MIWVSTPGIDGTAVPRADTFQPAPSSSPLLTVAETWPLRMPGTSGDRSNVPVIENPSSSE